VNADGYDDVIVGVLYYDQPELSEGAAFVFLGSGSGIVTAGNPGNADAQLEANQADALLGYSVAGAGDVDGDGYDDVIVGARRYDAPDANEGAAFVFLGNASGIADGDPSTAAAQIESNQANSLLGHEVAGAGDVNGDGYDDVIVGANYYSAGQTSEGAAFAFLGSASGIVRWGSPDNADAHLESNQEFARLGQSVAGAGDVNGDGYDDVIVGARNYDFEPEANEGVAFVYLGAPACDDGIDNDDDGYVDTADPACSSGSPYIPDAMAPSESTQCQDGANNDPGQDPNPGLIDFDGGQSIWGTCTGQPGGCPANVSDPEGDGVANPDPQCAGKPWKNQEKKSSSCGLGVELLLLAPLLWLWRRRGAAKPF
jgi:hypothetical protein